MVQKLAFICWLPEELGGERFLFKFDINIQEVHSLLRVMKSKLYRFIAGASMVAKFVKECFVMGPQH